MYEVGSTVVHPVHGIGTIEGIEEKTFAGTTGKFSIVFFPESGIRSMVNVRKVEDLLVKPVSRQEAADVLSYLEGWDGDLSANWKTRRQKNTERIISGDIYLLCEVVKGLSSLAQERDLNLRDRAHLDRARHLLAQQLSHARGEDMDDMLQRIDRLCLASEEGHAA